MIKKIKQIKLKLDFFFLLTTQYMDPETGKKKLGNF
jgi:hypothetical protein